MAGGRVWSNTPNLLDRLKLVDPRYCRAFRDFLQSRFQFPTRIEHLNLFLMPHIALPDGLPGITSAFAFRPETAAPLRQLADVLLRGPSSLTSGEREMIAAFVSARNECAFCHASHRAAAAHHLDGNYDLVDAVRCDPETAPISSKLKALVAIAAKVQQSGRAVTSADIARARGEGATDVEIHDAVLIAAAFCMFNRYVDGLATVTPSDPASYDQMGQRMAKEGYVRPGR
jgi:uncharacterized peroxidase-related enzyme